MEDSFSRETLVHEEEELPSPTGSQDSGSVTNCINLLKELYGLEPTQRINTCNREYYAEEQNVFKRYFPCMVGTKSLKVSHY